MLETFGKHPSGSGVKNVPARVGDTGRSLGREDPLEKEMAAPSSILGWRIPWTEEPGGYSSTGSQRVGHNRATKQQSHHHQRLFLFLEWERLSDTKAKESRDLSVTRDARPGPWVAGSLSSH